MGLLCHPLHCIISSLCSLYYAAMSDEGHQTESAIFTQKDDIIHSVLREEDLYQILGAPRTASPAELRRCYLERSKTCHPDKPPFHELSTSAFQRLGFAFDILKSPAQDELTIELRSLPPPNYQTKQPFSEANIPSAVP